MKRKIISLLLCLVMALSLIPTVAFGDGGGNATEDLTTNGAYSSNVWSAGGTGTIPTNDGLTLSKTAEYVSENTYKINLTVTTTQTTTTVTTSSDAATVLVIDCSGSMAWCSNTHRHTNACYEGKTLCTPDNNPGHWQYGRHKWRGTSCVREWDSDELRFNYYVLNCGQDVHTHDNASGGQWCGGSGDSRITSAKNAAMTFINNYKDSSADRWVAVVSFASNAASSDWFNVSTESGYSSAIAAIDDLSANGGTNLDAGLRAANSLMAADAVTGIVKENKNVIALTDGVPTYYYGSNGHLQGAGNEGSLETNNATAATATTLKESVNALYTICFASSGETCYEDKDSPTVDKFLANSIASSPDKAYTPDDASGLNLAFSNITNTITSGLTGEGGWTVTDPMADNISVVDGSTSSEFVLTDATSKTYTWTLNNPKVEENGSEKVYTYTTSYNVTIDPNGAGLNENDFYPTNKVTTLNYSDADGTLKTATFPVPGVKVKLPAPTPTTGSLKIEKVLAGDLVATDFTEGFSFTVWKGTEEIETIEVWPGRPITLTLEPAMYTIVENNAEVDGYKLATSYKVGNDTSNTGNVNVTENGATVTVTNTYEKESTPPVEEVPVDIPVTKTVSAKVGSTLPKNLPNFTFKAYLGEKEVGTLMLELNENTKVSGAQNQYRGTLTANIPAADFANNNNMVTLTIKEDKGIDTKWKYDTREYTVTVRMVIERAVAEDPLVIMLGNDVVDSVSFENIYSYKYTPAPKPTTPAKPVTSVKTGDMGVALYAGLAILSMTGSSGVILRRRKNDK